MKVDLHVHTKERSPCGRSSAVEQIQAAVSAGLGAIAERGDGQPRRGEGQRPERHAERCLGDAAGSGGMYVYAARHTTVDTMLPVLQALAGGAGEG